LYFLAAPIIALIYERGEFRVNDTLQTAVALQCYALGLVAYACVKVLSPAFYAINRRWTPMFVSFASIGLNLALNYHFMFRMGFGHWGLALATAISALFNFVVLYLLMRWYAGRMDGGRLVSTALRCALAAVVLGGVCWFGLRFDDLRADSLTVRVASLFILIGAAAGSYLLVCFVLRVEEVRTAVSLVVSKISRRLRR